MKRLILSVSLAALSGVALAQSAPAASDQTQMRTRQDEGGTVREPNYNAADPRNRRAEGQTATGAPKGERMRSGRSGDASSATPADQTAVRTRQDEGGTVREPNYNAADPRNRRAEGQTATGAPKGERMRSGRSGDASSATPADQTRLRTRQDEGGTVREPNYNAADPRNRRAERAGSGTGAGTSGSGAASTGTTDSSSTSGSSTMQRDSTTTTPRSNYPADPVVRGTPGDRPMTDRPAGGSSR